MAVLCGAVSNVVIDRSGRDLPIVADIAGTLAFLFRRDGQRRPKPLDIATARKLIDETLMGEFAAEAFGLSHEKTMELLAPETVPWSRISVPAALLVLRNLAWSHEVMWREAVDIHPLHAAPDRIAA